MLKVKSIHPFSGDTSLELSLVYPRISAGFPSPADNFFEEPLDLNIKFIKNPAATFCLEVDGDSMVGAGIFSRDILIVDRSLSPKNNSIIIAALNGYLTVKRLRKEKNKLFLMPENPDYPQIEITEEADMVIWGVAIYNIHGLFGST